MLQYSISTARGKAISVKGTLFDMFSFGGKKERDIDKESKSTNRVISTEAEMQIDSIRPGYKGDDGY